MKRPMQLAGCLAVTTLALSGCDYQGAASLPLPGGVSGPDTYPVSIVLDDATNLAVKETCRSNSVIVGSVSSISIGPDLKAHVVCAIQKSTHLPANTSAVLSSTSLLGEKFVALGPAPGQQASGDLPAGATIPDSGTRVDPDIEQVLGALSAVLNGGDLPKIATINGELNNALGGHEGDVRSLLGQFTTLTGELNAHSDDITRALDALNHLSGTLDRQRDVLGSSIDAIPAGLKVLNDQRPQLIALLQHLQQLSHTVVPLIDASEQDTVADLKSAQPILDNLATNGDQLATAARALLTYPFPNNGEAAVKGDYAGFYGTVHVDMGTINSLLALFPQPGPPPTAPGQAPAPPAAAVPGLPALSGVLDPATPIVPAAPSQDLPGLLSGGNR
ncbi:MCE family protein [Amycolatopsis sp. K13G38]|uniref:MCE family protein n=1 Tax=Amycolatopsis acididurans TaxID=2724524 RepID=A0ABX1JGS5_9PSEU|nr:MCE family protein [Amycolatopsis acididurans]NKQ57751.1 MCE family protein [Amycolatopsis acididurans]